MSFDDSVSRLLGRPQILSITAWTAHVLPGSVLHRAAFTAAEKGDRPAAERLYERAALAYQIGGDTEGLARLRTHRLLRVLESESDPAARDPLAATIAERIMRATPPEMLEFPSGLVDQGEYGDEGERRAG